MVSKGFTFILWPQPLRHNLTRMQPPRIGGDVLSLYPQCCDVREIRAADLLRREVASLHVEQHREIVTDASSKYEQMPDSVGVRIPMIEDIENDTDGVGDAPGEQPAKARLRD